jgi:hypothetical protein
LLGLEERGAGDGGDGDLRKIRTSGLLLRHWKAMVSSSFSRAVRAATGFGVDILGDVGVDVFGLRVWLGGWVV